MDRVIETRMLSSGPHIERRSASKPIIVGYASVFNQPSFDLGGFIEMVAPGAFAETIVADDIRALVNHIPSSIIGRNRGGTLRLREDPRGLRYEVDVPDTQLGRDLVASIERGDITGNSFSFETISDAWATMDGKEVRTLRKVKLFDVGPVTYPAYPQTDLSLRARQLTLASSSRTPRRDVREKIRALTGVDR